MLNCTLGYMLRQGCVLKCNVSPNLSSFQCMPISKIGSISLPKPAEDAHVFTNDWSSDNHSITLRLRSMRSLFLSFPTHCRKHRMTTTVATGNCINLETLHLARINHFTWCSSLFIAVHILVGLIRLLTRNFSQYFIIVMAPQIRRVQFTLEYDLQNER